MKVYVFITIVQRYGDMPSMAYETIYRIFFAVKVFLSIVDCSVPVYTLLKEYGAKITVTLGID